MCARAANPAAGSWRRWFHQPTRLRRGDPASPGGAAYDEGAVAARHRLVLADDMRRHIQASVLSDLAEVSPDVVPGKSAYKLLADQAEKYDPEILRAAQACLVLENGAASDGEHEIVADIPVSLLMAGYRLLSDIETKCGQLVLAKGQTVSDTQLTKIRNLSKTLGINEPIRVQKRLASEA